MEANPDRFIKIVIAIIVALIISGVVVSNYHRVAIVVYPVPTITLWQWQSIDTMKYSRDLARQKLTAPDFDPVIDQQLTAIAATGATHVAIATPYDAEFLPILKRWVSAARRHNLHVWFRGNWSGWEKWFDYPAITPDQHIAKTKQFIVDNPELFADGDIFSPCPECENGGPGDPRQTGLVTEYRRFLIDLQHAASGAITAIGKKVSVGFYSMNGDVAKLIMDPTTTSGTGGQVTIDHYVKTPEKLVADITSLVRSSGGTVILGEIGAPIPDIHGQLDDDGQARWLGAALDQVAPIAAVRGLNYWVNVGGSTALWLADGTPKTAVGILKRFYKPAALYGVVVDQLNQPIAGAQVGTTYRQTTTNDNGYYQLPVVVGYNSTVTIAAPGYRPLSLPIKKPNQQFNITLVRTAEPFWFTVKKVLLKLHF